MFFVFVYYYYYYCCCCWFPYYTIIKLNIFTIKLKFNCLFLFFKVKINFLTITSRLFFYFFNKVNNYLSIKEGIINILKDHNNNNNNNKIGKDWFKLNSIQFKTKQNKETKDILFYFSIYIFWAKIIKQISNDSFSIYLFILLNIIKKIN
jgi:hypothetical protein